VHAGRTPRNTPGALTVFILCGRFLTTKVLAFKAGELSPRLYGDYAATCKRLITAFGRNRLVSDLGPDDFQKLRATMATQWGRLAPTSSVRQERT